MNIKSNWIGTLIGLIISIIFIISLRGSVFDLLRDVSRAGDDLAFLLFILFGLLALGYYLGFVYADKIKPGLKYSLIIFGAIPTLGVLALETGVLRLGFSYGTGTLFEAVLALSFIAFGVLCLYHSFVGSYRAKKENRPWSGRFIGGLVLPLAAFIASLGGLGYGALIAVLPLFFIYVISIIIYLVAMLRLK